MTLCLAFLFLAVLENKPNVSKPRTIWCSGQDDDRPCVGWVDPKQAQLGLTKGWQSRLRAIWALKCFASCSLARLGWAAWLPVLSQYKSLLAWPDHLGGQGGAKHALQALVWGGLFGG